MHVTYYALISNSVLLKGGRPVLLIFEPSLREHCALLVIHRALCFSRQSPDRWGGDLDPEPGVTTTGGRGRRRAAGPGWNSARNVGRHAHAAAAAAHGLGLARGGYRRWPPARASERRGRAGPRHGPVPHG